MPSAVAQRTAQGQLFAVAVSNVAYVRKLFPENAFFDKNLEGISLKILKEEASCPGTCKVVFWLRGCFDAIEKRYLRKATLALYEDPQNPKTIMESFTFTFKYGGAEGASMEMESSKAVDPEVSDSETPRDEKIKSQTTSLLNTILAAGKMLGPLPKKMMLTMKLQYYETTPADYMPHGFKVDENPEINFENGPVNLKVGVVDTTFHSVRMLVHTVPSLITASPEKLKSALEVVKPKDSNQSSHGITEKRSNICHTPRCSFQPTEVDTFDEAEDNYEVLCPCGVNSDDGVMILCDGCEKWQHAVCFRIIDDEDIPKSHLCNRCVKTKPEMIESGSRADRSLFNLTEEQTKSTCLLRRALLLCVDNDLLSVGSVAKRLSVEASVAKGLLNKLQDEGAVKDVRGRSGNKAVLKAHVEAVLLPRFFSLDNMESSEKVMNEGPPTFSESHIPSGKRGRCAEVAGLTKATGKLNLVNDMSFLSQESVDSPGPSKRRRSYNTVNTPIPVVPR